MLNRFTLETPVINHATASTLRSTARGAAITLPARLTWKDANGAVRFTSVRTREVTETGAVVECDAAVSLPLYRLVHLQVEESAREWVELPQPLRGAEGAGEGAEVRALIPQKLASDDGPEGDEHPGGRGRARQQGGTSDFAATTMLRACSS